MPQICKTPAGTGASRDSFVGLSLCPFSPAAMRLQLLIVVHHVWPELAVMAAAFAFGGHSQ